MTLKMIDEVYLYSSNKPEDTLETTKLVAWFDHSGIPYTNLAYIEPKPTIDAVNTWWEPDVDTGITQEPLTALPFVIYTEIHDSGAIRRKYIFSAESIIEKLPSIYAIGR